MLLLLIKYGMYALMLVYYVLMHNILLLQELDITMILVNNLDLSQNDSVWNNLFRDYTVIQKDTVNQIISIINYTI